MKTSFYDLPLLTAPGRVFTPRASTERLVDEALQRIDGVPMRIADVGTGSGAVAIALAVNRPQVGGTLLIQFHRDPLAANCWELEDLREQLEASA
jgi:methylase of polypeptide subunit release factors